MFSSSQEADQPPKSHQELEEKVLKAIKSDRTLSVRKLMCGCSVGTVHKIKVKNGIKSLKKKKVPKKSIKQEERAKLRAGRLYRFLVKQKERCIMMDDETYAFLDTQLALHTQFYMAGPGEQVPIEERVIPTGKFEKKALIWQAICSCGKKTTILYTLGTVTSAVYVMECIKKRLLALARAHDEPPLFWPDLASVHYAKDTLKILEELNIEIVPKELNPPNSPELRPIEKYWALCKRQLFEQGGVAENLGEFKKMWARAAKKVPEDVVQTLMRGVLAKIRLYYRGSL